MDKYNIISLLNSENRIEKLTSCSNSRITVSEKMTVSLDEHKNQILMETRRIETSFQL
ncbi:MAG: hypothetical protein SOV49_01050 [Erysipelotrichaceae bacterium]|nr:hypothetical protein [Erysipelotrichaceae bacterium]